MTIEIRSTRWTVTFVVLLVLCCARTIRAQDLSVSPGTAQPPGDLAESVRALLAPASTTVTLGDNTLEFWWVKALALQTSASGAPAWTNVPEGTLVGAMRVAKPMTDIRGLALKPGVYTLRFALQPQDGDHMGVSMYREFFLVAPAADDQTVEAIGHAAAVRLAKRASGKSHPSALSLDPPTSNKTAGTVVTNDAGHKALTFSVPTTSSGGPGGSLTFGLILVGTIQHQM